MQFWALLNKTALSSFSNPFCITPPRLSLVILRGTKRGRAVRQLIQIMIWKVVGSNPSLATVFPNRYPKAVDSPAVPLSFKTKITWNQQSL